MTILGNITSATKQKFLTAAAVSAVFAIMATEAYAGTGTGTFDSVWQTLTDWSQGTLGRIIALSMIFVGVVAGITRQSIMSFAVGLGAGVGLYNAPDIVESIMQATLPTAEKATSLLQMSNGLL